MLLVRQPIPRAAQIILGTLSILMLIGLYSLLANTRQEAKRDVSRAKLANARADLSRLEAQLAAAAPSDAAELRLQFDVLQEQAGQFDLESRTAVDRTVPTWTSLYHDGLLRVLRPQGLRHDEYWLWRDTVATARRLIRGLMLGVLLSVTLGILMGAYAPVGAFFVPPLAFLAKIPPTAMLAVFFVLVGTTLKMYVAMIAFGTLPTLAQTVYQSARKDVPESLVFKAYTLGASHAELIWNVIYKQILPRLIDAVRLQVGPAMVLLVAAEWMVAGEGFGYRLRLFYQRTDMTVVYVYLLLLGLAGLVIDYALVTFRRKLCPWFGD
jgi:NitT/TauT family transport system permease protein